MSVTPPPEDDGGDRDHAERRGPGGGSGCPFGGGCRGRAAAACPEWPAGAAAVSAPQAAALQGEKQGEGRPEEQHGDNECNDDRDHGGAARRRWSGLPWCRAGVPGTGLRPIPRRRRRRRARRLFTGYSQAPVNCGSYLGGLLKLLVLIGPRQARRIPVTVATLECFGSCDGRSRKARSAATER
jgi:hypothetical protein